MYVYTKQNNILFHFQICRFGQDLIHATFKTIFGIVTPGRRVVMKTKTCTNDSRANLLQSEVQFYMGEIIMRAVILEKSCQTINLHPENLVSY